ncbi:hypothetical protein OHA40_28190 [Nocardia sp. NBC_00508]|uniref:hypothetical protein n=1 Tax=Nocardia sp. NBC_00508 TaxID=2975992 RepID=UPI002E80F0F9|nr:hypothetical protein [Nocardia sp. NBC_00508]WUD65468.1 hypothetical protein OHA40_28190 [Nocardia sp. NBC_00508]
MSDQSSPNNRDTDLAPLAPIALVLGLAMIVTALATVVRIPGWAVDYGIMVLAAGFLYLALATWLVHWGVGQLRNHSGDA